MFTKIERFIKDRLNTSSTVSALADHDHSLMVATAALFIEVATADFEMSEEEEAHIELTLESHFEIDRDEVRSLLDTAREIREGRQDIWQFAQALKDNYRREQRIDLLEKLWQLIYADGTVDKYEDSLIRKITMLLGLDHSDMIQAKLLAGKKSALKKSG